MLSGIFSSGSSVAYLYIGLLLCAAVGYFTGSLNFSIIVSRLRYRDDIRNYGSKNAGLTNMLRTYGRGAAALVLLGDMSKAAVSCLVGMLLLGESGGYIAGFFCVLGHAFPVYYKLRGGKSVLTLATMVLVMNWQVFLVLFTIFVIIVSFTKYISLGSVMCVLLYPIMLSRLGEPNLFAIIPSIIIAVLVVALHRSNIKRLMAGEENKIALGKDGQPMKKWLLALINITLIVATLGSFFLNIVVRNGALERGRTAVVHETAALNELQLRYLYLRTAEEYLTDEANADSEAVKNYNSEVKYCEQSINGETYAELFMRLTKEKISSFLPLYCEAIGSGYVEPNSSDDDVRVYYTEFQASFRPGDDIETYLRYKYGRGIKNSDVGPVLQAQALAERFRKNNEDDTISGITAAAEITYNEKCVQRLLESY